MVARPKAGRRAIDESPRAESPRDESPRDQRIAAVRRFNRLYTRRIGALQEGHLKSPFSLAEVRVLYELAHRESPTATELAKELGLDAGYLSRIVRGFERRGLVARRRSEADGRRSLLRLTARGRKTFASLDARAHEEIGAMVDALSPGQQLQLVDAIQTVERLLGAEPERDASYVLRPHHVGDMGWIVHRQGALYAQEYAWDEQFEALAAHIAADFIQQFDPKRERCWIAERGGEIVGSVFLVKKSKTVAKLRLLYVEPSARGLGIGARLVSECVRTARAMGYRTLTLWTQSILHAARHIYQQHGFRLVSEEPHHSFGHDLVAQTWELELGGSAER